MEIEPTKDVQKTPKASFERLMYVQVTSFVFGDYLTCRKCFYVLQGKLIPKDYQYFLLRLIFIM